MGNSILEEVWYSSSILSLHVDNPQFIETKIVNRHIRL